MLRPKLRPTQSNALGRGADARQRSSKAASFNQNR